MALETVESNGGSGMPKPFKEMTIEPQDDGQFQVNVTPWIDPKSLKKEESLWDLERAGTLKFTVDSLGGIESTFKSLNKPKKRNAKEEMNAFFNGES